ncbi:hypothetical protein [Streptomyces sp. 4F14]|uniref:hypothetical protein n=1 Tax=Streptomyces sp. 4F14 TaxID=3394380 RepID=UPI003A8634EB
MTVPLGPPSPLRGSNGVTVAPVDAAFDAEGRCLVGDDHAGTVVRIGADDLPVTPAALGPPALFTHGMTGSPRLFAGLAAALILSADGEGTVRRFDTSTERQITTP